MDQGRKITKISLNSKVEVSRIGQGITGIDFEISSSNRLTGQRIESIQFGVERGLTLLDTAENYGNGASETLVGLAVRKIREKVQIATKYSPENSEYRSVVKSAENSLKRLKTDYIDLYQVHWPNPTIPMSETFAALIKLKEQEKILMLLLQQ